MCGIGAVVQSKDLVRDLYKLGTSLQHRGQESAGASLSAGSGFVNVNVYGSVDDLFEELAKINFDGDRGLVHTRFSTTGDSNCQNSQPVVVGDITLGHNGNLVNTEELSKKYSQKYTLKTQVDSELIACIFDDSHDLVEGARRCVIECDGAYNLVLMNRGGEVAAFRDPHGYHPLYFGKKNGTVFVASEDICLTGLEIYEHHEIIPGDLLIFRDGEIHVEHIATKPLLHCPFEDAYLKSYGSMSFVDNILTHDQRRKIGRLLAIKYPAAADFVVPLLDSGISYGMGYSGESGIPLEFGLSKNRAIARTYMAADGKGEPMYEKIRLTRREKAALKNPPLLSLLKGKRIVVTDDSVVRGNVTSDLVHRLKEAGVSEIHLRIGFPPVRHPCLYGMDHGPRDGLIAAQYSEISDEEMGEYVNRKIGATSLAYLPKNDWERILNKDFCWSCVTGKYNSEPRPV